MKIKKSSGNGIKQTALIIGTIVAVAALGYDFVKDGLAANKEFIKDELTAVNVRIDKLDAKVDKLEEKVDKRFDKMENKFDKLADKVDQVENTLIGHTAGHSHIPMVDTTAPAVEKDATASAALLPEKAEEPAAQESQQ